MASTRGLVNLDRDRQILTRLQSLQIRRTFPFLSLPPELRNMIYELCIDVGPVEKYFDRYYKKIEHKEANKKYRASKCYKTTPSILLINRQIFNEAVGLILKESITFSHGMFDLGDVTKVVSQHVLQQISSLTVNVKGHHVVQTNILRESWSGYMDLLTQLSTLLADGHNLKNLTIDLEDPDLTIHVTTCWDAGSTGPNGYKCDFRDHLAQVFSSLRSIRGVGNVTLKGFPPNLAPSLQARMESKPIHILDLPGEIRNQIYTHAASISDINDLLNAHMTSWTERRTPMPSYPPKTTPTILLLNKRITSEALPLLRSAPLHLTFRATHTLEKQPQVPPLTAFISAPSLQRLRHLHLRLEKWEWIYSLETLFRALGAKHSLQSFRLHLRDGLKPKLLRRGFGRYYPDRALHESLVGLKRVRGVQSVVIEGDLPAVYAGPLAEIMRRPAGETGALPRLMGVGVDGGVVDVEALVAAEAAVVG